MSTKAALQDFYFTLTAIALAPISQHKFDERVYELMSKHEALALWSEERKADLYARIIEQYNPQDRHSTVEYKLGEAARLNQEVHPHG